MKQFGIIMVISLMGEVLKWLIPLPVPASIYGLILMFAALATGLVPLDAVRETSRFLIEIMPLMFIPAAVGLLNSWSLLKPILIPISVITLITTILVMAATGRAAQLVIGMERKKRAEKHE